MTFKLQIYVECNFLGNIKVSNNILRLLVLNLDDSGIWVSTSLSIFRPNKPPWAPIIYFAWFLRYMSLKNELKKASFRTHCAQVAIPSSIPDRSFYQFPVQNYHSEIRHSQIIPSQFQPSFSERTVPVPSSPADGSKSRQDTHFYNDVQSRWFETLSYYIVPLQIIPSSCPIPSRTFQA